MFHLFILPIAVNIPVSAAAAEGVKTLDLAVYKDLAEVDQELITKFVEVNTKPGFSMDMKFNLDAGYELDIEGFPPQHFVIGGDMKMASTENYNATIDTTMKTNISGEEATLKYEMFVVNHDQNPDDVLVIAYSSTGSDAQENDSTMATVQKETVPRTELEKWNLSSLTVEDVKKFATFKVVEDKGENVDIVALISINEINNFLTRATSFTVDGDTVETFELDKATETIKKLGEEFNIETFVLPVYLTLEKASGHIKSVKYQATGLQEIIDKSYELEKQNASENESGIPTATVKLNDFNFEISNVQYGATERIIVPQHVLEALAAERTAEQAP